MGMYVAVRGWLEIDDEQRTAAERIIARHQDGFYSGGWTFPVKPFNWSLYLFYGGDIREVSVGWLYEQVAELARMDPVDEDNDMPAGFFLLSDERQRSFSWTIRDAQVIESVAPAELHWFAHRP